MKVNWLGMMKMLSFSLFVTILVTINGKRLNLSRGQVLVCTSVSAFLVGAFWPGEVFVRIKDEDDKG